MLEYAGMKSPVMLEGGFLSWRDAKYPIEKKIRPTRPTEFRVHQVPSVLATTGQVRALSRSRKGIVLDVRSKGEYEGSENRECCPRPGRVPGAVWLEWTDFLDGTGSFKGRQSIARQLQSIGTRPTSDIAIYCHRGARAASAFYALRSMGYHRARNYVGSWHEWSAKKTLPAQVD
jgi:thiosulfate/3-mercaptopyruvate sulfurtransferase